MRARGGRGVLAALLLTYVAIGVYFAVALGAGPGIGALAVLELLGMLALAAGVAWASSRRRR